MKYQQVSVDLVNMMITACSYLALAGAAWILLRLLQACFWLPRHFRKQDNVQKLLQDKVDSYEKYLAECEARDKLEGVDCNLEGIDDDTTAAALDDTGNTDKWRKQRESLEMLKKELDRVRDGINVTDWDYLLEESQQEGGCSSMSKKDMEEHIENEYDINKDPKDKEGVKISPKKDKEIREGKETDEKKDK